MKDNNNGREILKLLQENYEINTAKDLSSAFKDMFKGALQEMMNVEFDSSMGYSKYDKSQKKTNYRNGSTKKKEVIKWLRIKHLEVSQRFGKIKEFQKKQNILTHIFILKGSVELSQI